MRAVTFFLLLPLFCSAQEFVPLDQEGSISFSIKNFGFNVKGELRGLVGRIVFDPIDREKSSFFISVNARSINTGVELRDNHLKREEYLNTHDYPVIQFSSIDVKKRSD